MCFQRFDDDEDFGSHGEGQIRVVSEGSVAAASAKRMSCTKPSSSELWEMKSFPCLLCLKY
jgi:hypothetical protein